MPPVGINKWMNAKQGALAGVMTLLVAVFIITPLCGYLFSCGCSWPWNGLAAKCNYFDPLATEKCPWCLSKPAAILSIGGSMLAAYVTALRIRISVKITGHWFVVIILASATGLLVFLLTAVFSAWLSAMMQGYSQFLFNKVG